MSIKKVFFVFLFIKVVVVVVVIIIIIIIIILRKYQTFSFALCFRLLMVRVLLLRSPVRCY